MSTGSATTNILTLWARLVKFEHTVFAFPFALSMGLVVTKFYPVHWNQLLWIVFSLVSARTAAMAWNRILDRKIDAQNARTQNRELVTGVVSYGSAVSLAVGSSIVFLFCSAALGMHCLVLAPFVLGFLAFYSWTKRFTIWSHFVLGIALALAPGGVWYALTAKFAFLPIIQMTAVACWVAGFDILYSCQDIGVDKKLGLHSVPSKVGAPQAFRLAQVAHIISVALLVAFGVSALMGSYYFVGVALFGVLLLSQYFLITPTDLKQIDAAFFTRNGFASVFYFLAVALDVFAAA